MAITAESFENIWGLRMYYASKSILVEYIEIALFIHIL